MIEKIEYNCLPGGFAISNAELLSQCADLYSNHYGKWGEGGIHPNENIKLSENRICEWLDSETVSIYYATHEKKVIGYAIAFRRNEYNYGVVTWVTQLVVHKEYRHHGIAKNILFSIWGFSNDYAWGIVSANPYAVRALEKATRRRAKPVRIKKNAIKLKNIGRKNVPFITDNTVFQITNDTSVVNTEFFVDHSDTKEMLLSVTNEETPWNLGSIDEGWEWFAFTFKDQEQFSLTNEEIEKMIASSDSVVRQAYARMDLKEKKHKWMKHTTDEVNYIIEKTGLQPSDLVYDLGCGRGRHSIELARKKMNVVGIDYISQNVEDACKKIEENSLENVEILEADCRYYTNARKASVVLCLYDVIGSYAVLEENYAIIENAYKLLETKGYAVFSVMNYESTLKNTINKFTLKEEPDKLLNLPASKTMEESGDVFDPNYYMVDVDTHLAYRKEQFSKGYELPVELIVRDRRFTMEEIVDLCEKVGFSVVEARYVNASDWRKSYSATDTKAKEILIVCQKKNT